MRGFDTSALADGTYRLEVAAADTRGNTGIETVSLGIRNEARASVAGRVTHGIPS